jgi:uncharacterized membrane protein (UPF0127 family)
MSKQNLKYGAYGAAALAILLVLAGVFIFQQGLSARASFGEDELAIISPGGATHVFKIEIAETPQQLAQGLMYRDHLDSDRGMLFIFPSVEEATMWMHNTQIALDMLFIDPDGKIAHIAANNRPFDDRQIPSTKPVRGVIEINAGKAAELGLKEGDRVRNQKLEKALKP